MMTPADAVTKSKPDDPVPVVKMPVIDPDRCQVQADGFAYRELFVRLPEGFIADHLNSRPEAWARFQSRPGRALRKFDRVVAVAWDESWLAELLVSEARFDRVFFAKPKIITFGERYDKLLEDDNYRVEWIGSGYAVRRKKDRVVVSQPVATAALAERDLRNLYPRPMP